MKVGDRVVYLPTRETGTIERFSSRDGYPIIIVRRDRPLRHNRWDLTTSAKRLMLIDEWRHRGFEA